MRVGMPGISPMIGASVITPVMNKSEPKDLRPATPKISSSDTELPSALFMVCCI